MGRRAGRTAWHVIEAEGKRDFTAISYTFRLRAHCQKHKPKPGTSLACGGSVAARPTIARRVRRCPCGVRLVSGEALWSAGAARREIDGLGPRLLRSAGNGRWCTRCLQPGAVGPVARSRCDRGGVCWEPGRREERVVAAALLKAAGLTVKGRNGSQQLWSAPLAELTHHLSLWKSLRFD